MLCRQNDVWKCGCSRLSSRLVSSDVVEHIIQIVVVVHGDGPHVINGDKKVHRTVSTRIASGGLVEHSCGERPLNVRGHAIKLIFEITSHIVSIGSQKANQITGSLNQSGRKMVRCPIFRWEHHVVWGVEKLEGW